jgi:sterol 3beta-glucosyltransferase
MQIQENGVATAIESIYRDLDYARSLIKRTVVEDADEDDNEHSTIRNRDPVPGHVRSPSSTSGHSSTASLRAAPSEDWSVISDQEDQEGERHSPEISPNSEGRGIKQSPSKRTSIAAAMLSVLPDL